MLREYWLNRVALACGIAGAIILFYYSLLVTPEAVSISEINEEMLGDRVEVEARVEWRFEKNSVLMFTLDDGNKIKAVRFSPNAVERFAVQKNAFLKVVGRVQKYRGELEIIAERVELLD